MHDLTFFTSLADHTADARRRGAKMSSNWRRQTRPQGTGYYSVRSSSARRWNQREEPAAPPASASGGAAAKPTAADCTAAGFYASPVSCQAFYRCVDWMGDGSWFSIFHFTCPVGTVFDEKISVCNHPGASGRPECLEGGDTGAPSGTTGESGLVSVDPDDEDEEEGDDGDDGDDVDDGEDGYEGD